MTQPNLIDPPPDPGSPSPASRGRPVPGDQMEPDRFGAFYRSWFRSLVRFLIVGGLDFAEAEDVAQESFTALLANLRYVHAERARSYLFVTARRMAAKRISERNRAIPTDDIGEEANIGFAEGAEVKVADQEIVLRMLRGLPPVQRTIMALIYEGFNPAEIGEMLKITPSTVRSNLRHARHALKEELSVTAADRPGMPK